MIYWTTMQRQNPGGAKYHDYPLGLNVYLNTTDNTKLHINTWSHFTFDAMDRWPMYDLQYTLAVCF